MSIKGKNDKRRLSQVMLFIIFLVIALLALLIVSHFSMRNNIQIIPPYDVYSIDSKEFVGFEKCQTGDKLSVSTGRLIKIGKPIKTEENTFTYEIKSEVMGLPVKAIMIGVCNDGVSQSCGWGSFLAVVIPKPMAEVRNHLKAKTGIDFAEEIRSKESEVTLRPVLATGQNSNESVLYCDPGIT